MPANLNDKIILVVDDEPDFEMLHQFWVGKLGNPSGSYDVVFVKNEDEAMAAVKQYRERIGIVFMDYRLGGKNGTVILENIVEDRLRNGGIGYEHPFQMVLVTADDYSDTGGHEGTLNNYVVKLSLEEKSRVTVDQSAINAKGWFVSMAGAISLLTTIRKPNIEDYVKGAVAGYTRNHDKVMEVAKSAKY